MKGITERLQAQVVQPQPAETATDQTASQLKNGKKAVKPADTPDNRREGILNFRF